MKLYKKVCKTPGTQFRWLTEHGCVWSVSNWFFFPSSDLFFKKSKPYFLRPVLGSHQNWVESTECSHMHSGFRHSQPPPPDQDAPGSCTRATKRIHMDTSWSPNVHSLQKGPLLVSTHSVSLDKSIMTFVYKITQNRFTALKTSWTLLLHPSLHSPKPWQPLIFF